MIGIIAAMPLEAELVLSMVNDGESERICGIKCTRGMLNGVEVIIAQCGIGKVFAALCAAILIDHYHPDLLLNIGIAGALDARLDIADYVIADSAVEHDVDTTPIGDPPGLISGPNIVHMPVSAAASERLYRLARAFGTQTVRGAIATGDQFIERLEDKKRISQQFKAAACDMEGGAIAQVSMVAGVPYAAYRAVSDTLTGNGQEYSLNASRAAEASARLLSAFLTDLKETPYEF